MAIIVPVLGKAKEQARAIVGMNNQKQVVSALNLFALDNSDFYPESVAMVKSNNSRKGTNPAKLISVPPLKVDRRSVGEYLNTYIPDADTIYCPSAPRKYKYLQEAWEAGNDWDNPDTPIKGDPLIGTYSLFWDYTGYIGGYRVTLQGSRTPAGGRFKSKLLISDYFVYDNYNNRGAYSSC